MAAKFDDAERSPGELILFGLGFVGFVLAAAAIVVGSPGGAITGWLILLFSVACLQLHRSPGDR